MTTTKNRIDEERIILLLVELAGIQNGGNLHICVNKKGQVHVDGGPLRTYSLRHRTNGGAISA